MLCNRCRVLDFTASPYVHPVALNPTSGNESDSDSDDASNYYYTHLLYPNLEGLFYSSDLGCQLCSQICYSLYPQLCNSSLIGPIKRPLIPRTSDPKLIGHIYIQIMSPRREIDLKEVWLKVCVRTSSSTAGIAFDIFQYDCKSAFRF